MRVPNFLKSLKHTRKAHQVLEKPTAERSQKKSSTELSRANLETMLGNSYKSNAENGPVDNYVLDPTLSDNRVKTYYDPNTKHTVVAHRGSATGQDWLENAMYGIGIKRGANRKHSREMQKKVDAKYGSENLTTIGHSKGASHAQEFGQKGDVVTLNKPVNVTEALRYKVTKNQTDYRGEGDVVSALRGVQGGKKAVTLKKSKGQKTSWNPIKNILDEHATETLSRGL